MPERLASHIRPLHASGTQGSQGGAQRDASGRFTKELPGKWESAQGLLGALGHFVPVLGELSRTMGAISRIAGTWEAFKGAHWGGDGADLPKPGAQSAFPTGAQQIKWTPTTPPPPIVGPASTSPPPLPQTYAGGTQSALPPPVAALGPQELLGAIKQLTDEIRRLREVTKQEEPDETEGTERVPEKEIEEGPKPSWDKWPILPLQSEKNKREQKKVEMPVRPQQDVPSSKDQGSGTGEIIGAVIKALI